MNKPIIILLITIALILKLTIMREIKKDNNFRWRFATRKQDLVVFVLLIIFLSKDFSNIKRDLGLLITSYFFIAFSIGYFIAIEKIKYDAE
jgi:hypothetical protein